MDKEQTAIARMKLAANMSQRYYKEPLLLTNSGGKDSLVCLAIARRAGIPFDVLHSHTTADMPETVRYVRRQMKNLEAEGHKCQVAYPVYQGKPTSMWKLIPDKGIMPTRRMRYCCVVLKETGGANRAVVTGVRRAESSRRSFRDFAEKMGRRKEDAIRLNFEDASELFDSDGQGRQFTEHDEEFLNHCRVRGKTVFNPIVDWEEKDVWDYIESEHLDLNPIYKKYGLNRCGCIGCPLANWRTREREFRFYPQYKKLYIEAFRRMLERRRAKGKEITITPERLFDIFMERKVVPGQISFLDEKNNGTKKEDNHE